ncbi:heme biosynthesis HemY N-terminal domain-containing protein [Thalassotalea fonticola]|uniref:Heme biosynthesis HemY N-terminal domain-containing protein n=1 Tax=Thalassotalea fonticola TaxID=3065649 RepID=A0ABZ0GN59_9GAMM|nr:heme biosynthesis HemY N-terminal domain-containing protein [Colwelliaceae bacterium S1-1]
MIRSIIKLVLLLALIAIAPFLIDEKGYILIAMGDLTYELTVVSAILLMVLASFIFAFLFWGTRIGFKFSSSAWRKLAFSNRAKAKREFQKGLGAYLLEDYKQAEALMAKCAEHTDMANSAWLVAASSANKLGESAKTANYLQFIAEHPQAQENFSFETLLVAGRLNLDDKQFSKARALLNENHKLIGHDGRLLGLDIEINIHEDKFEQATALLQIARKDKNLDKEKITDWEVRAFTGYFSELIAKSSVDAVAKYYKALSRKERQSEGIVLAYAHCLVANGLVTNLENLVLPLIKKDASLSFINAVKQLPIQNSEHIIFAVQKILQKQPENILWLSALAHLCVANKEYDKAHKAFTSLLKIEQASDDLQCYAKLLELMGEHQQANRVYQELIAQG